ncbi:growth-regulating factor 3 [Musa acuminata AAA Group]|uniref:growth-regulating factor 3 n=1 Tax=Musa acuminata AAA Group TaxID=214697 RepID=UPI0031D4569F
MDSHRWSERQQTDRQPCAGLPKLHLLDQQQPPASALSLFAPEPCSGFHKTTTTTIAAPSLSSFPRIGYFTLAQWQELELQALIYKYMIAGVSVPLELILPIKRSLLSASPYYHHPELYQHLQPSLMQGVSWGRCSVDPEPGRCRRTDGKKWRCSREVVVGQKYCERHVHRGRNRSRKHVEIPTPTSLNGLKTGVSSPPPECAQHNHFGLSGSRDILPLSQRHPDTRTVTVGRSFQSNCSNFFLKELQDSKPEGYVLQRFFDEWPRSQQESDDGLNYTSHPASTTHLSMSLPGNPSSDFSLKLSTGNNGEKQRPEEGSSNGGEDGRVVRPSNNWSGWGHHGEEASMGGPLAEALRSAASTQSPTSVLHKPNGSVSETSSISP